MRLVLALARLGSPLVAVRVVWALSLSRVLLAVLPPARAIDALLDVAPRRSRRLPDHARLIALTHGIARRMPWQPTCLERALASGRLLAAADVHGRIVIGVRVPGAAAFAAHAWVELPGAVADAGLHRPLAAWGFPIRGPR